MSLDTETKVLQAFCYVREEREVNYFFFFFTILVIFEIKKLD